jgi:hypothetical protein
MIMRGVGLDWTGSDQLFSYPSSLVSLFKYILLHGYTFTIRLNVQTPKHYRSETLSEKSTIPVPW